MAKSNFWNFITAPKNVPAEKFSFLKAAKIFGVLLFVKLILLIFIITVKVSLEHFFDIAFPEKLVKVADQSKSKDLLFLQNVIFAPILEELLFRLPMRFSYVGIILFPSLSVYLISKSLGFLFLKSFFFAVVTGIILTLLLCFNNVIHCLRKFYRLYFPQIFYFLTLYFSFFHINSYSVDTSNFVLVPIIILPHFISGLIYGYVRIKYLIWGSIIMHILHNLILFSLKFN